jgi:hypothetical protein
MPHKEQKEDYCSAKIREHRVPDEWDQDVAYCANRSGFRTDHFDEGRCYLHGGCSKSANEGNNYAEKHGLYADRQNYYKNRSPEEQQWIDAVTESLLDDAPFDGDNFAKMQMVRNIAIDMHKMQDANTFIDQTGLARTDKTVAYGPDGSPIKEDKENPINVTYDRLNRTMTRQLKELGILDDPESQQAEASQNIANELSELRSARDE